MCFYTDTKINVDARLKIFKLWFVKQTSFVNRHNAGAGLIAK
ncbi:hypothetical protein QWZ13_12145 [Reinekea marina]|nr:hypothetical protein [Reinekea marina]MDN3649665.1 hypothetical protein [Reinekea marina]